MDSFHIGLFFSWCGMTLFCRVSVTSLNSIEPEGCFSSDGVSVFTCVSSSSGTMWSWGVEGLGPMP